METNDIISLIVVLVAGFAWGWTARERAAVARVDKMMKEVSEQVEDAVSDTIVPIIIEQEQNQYYVYAVKDRTFMAQGASRKELEDNLVKRYPGKTFAATPANLKEIGFNYDTNSK